MPKVVATRHQQHSYHSVKSPKTYHIFVDLANLYLFCCVSLILMMVTIVSLILLLQPVNVTISIH